MRVSTCLVLAALVGLVASSARTAEGACRTSTCRDVPICDGVEQLDPSCIPLAWKRPCVGVSLQVNGSEQVPFEVANALVTKAFQTWEEPACDELSGGKPNIHVENMGPIECDLVQYNSRAANANVVVFRDLNWPHPSGPHNIALTTVTYDTRTGEIYDADMELNTAEFGFSTSDGDVQTDLLSVLTHEAGHFLGLTHSLDSSATMWANYTTGNLGPRTLAVDDIAGICSVYPAVDPPVDKATCNPIPRHGFSPACLSKQTEGDCSVSGPLGTSRDGAGAMVMVMVVTWLRLRRQTGGPAQGQ
ncbi:MAG: matrixin family metalloprotease [Polyangiaceae bacterium]|nr:matrixin family metalloprotease [Polyangiaceae bacterium]